MCWGHKGTCVELDGAPGRWQAKARARAESVLPRIYRAAEKLVSRDYLFI